ncbi:MAG: glycosyltransferase [Anaerolineales bacterium]
MTAMPTVAYISQQFPSLTTTFVYREVLALRRFGVTVRSISTWKPDRAALSAEAQALVGETFYIFPVSGWELLRLHFHYLFARPAQYLGAFLLVVVWNGEPLRNRLRSLGHFAYAVRAAAEVERCGVQHLHADYALNAATVALVAARLTGRPFSFAAHAADLFINPVMLREKIVAAAFITPISDFNRRLLLQTMARADVADKIHVVHCGLALEQFVPESGRPSNARPLIVGVGRLIEKKGFRFLIEACRQLVEHGIDFECRIAGGGPEAASLQTQIDQAGLTDRVHLTGPLPQEQVRELMRRAEVFALPCVQARDRDQDGIPVVLMEAMALQRPVISTPLSGIPELVHDGANGLLVPAGDSAALAQGLARLLADKALRESLGRAGRTTVARAFNVDVSAKQMAGLFAGSDWRLPARASQNGD